MWLLLIPVVLVAIYVVGAVATWLHQAELKRITPSNAELKELAKRYPIPQEWWDE